MKIIVFVSLFIFCITNTNAQWVRLYGGLPVPSNPIYKIIVDPDQPQNIFAGGDDKLYFSSDNGDNWNRLYSFPRYNIPIIPLAINGQHIFVDGKSKGLIISHDYGHTWMADTLSFYDKSQGHIEYVHEIYTIQIKNNNLYAGTNWGLFISKDNGYTWNKFDDYDPRNQYVHDAFSDMYSIVLKDSIIIASIMPAIIKSIDSGRTWYRVSKDLKDYYDYPPRVEYMIKINNSIFAIVGESQDMGHGIFKSINDGENWELVHEFGGYNCVWYLISCNNNNIFTFNRDNGIYFSNDFGKSFDTINKGLPYFIEEGPGYCIEAIAINDKYIYACVGTWGLDCGIYRAPLKDCAIDTKPTDIPETPKNNSFNISPNPASDNISISFPGVINQSIHIYNSLGIEIKRFEEKDLFEKNSINVSMEGFPSGMYYVRQDIGCLADIRCLTKSFVVIR